MDLRPDALEAAQELEVVLERQVGVQPIDDVHFGERLIAAHAQLLPRLFHRHRVRAGIAGTQPRERAEQTARDADVRRLDADVVVVVRQIAVPPLPLAVGERRHGEQIGMLEEPHAVLEREPLAVLELLGNFAQHHAIVSQPAAIPNRPSMALDHLTMERCYTARPQPTFPR